MKKIALCVAVATVALAGSIDWSAEAAVVAMKLEEVTAASPLIVRGRVVDQKVHWVQVSHGEAVVTDWTVNVSETLKGQAVKSLTVRTYGGRIGEFRMHASDQAQLAFGEDVALFLSPHPHDTARLHSPMGAFQGKYTLINDRVREATNTDWATFKKRVAGFIEAK